MTAAPGIDEPPLLWRGDPTVIVYAVRHVLEHPGSHAPELVAQAVVLNARRLPAGARRQLVRVVTDWLTGAGARATREKRSPWLRALGALDVEQQRDEAEPADDAR